MNLDKLKAEIKTLTEQATKPLNVKALTMLDRISSRISDFEEAEKERAAKAKDKADGKKSK